MSPAPSVSTSDSGGKASDRTRIPSGPSAAAPASAQAHTRTALKGATQSGRTHREGWAPAQIADPRTLTSTHPFLTRLYIPFRASSAVLKPKWRATSLLTKTLREGVAQEIGSKQDCKEKKIIMRDRKPKWVWPALRVAPRHHEETAGRAALGSSQSPLTQ